MGFGTREGAAATVRVTGTVSAPPVLLQAVVGTQVSTTLPLYEPAPRVLATLVTIETVSVPGVVPLPGETDSQLPPLLVVAAALYEMAEPEELTNKDVLGDEPCVYVRDIEVGLADKTGAAATVRVTGTLSVPPVLLQAVVGTQVSTTWPL